MCENIIAGRRPAGFADQGSGHARAVDAVGREALYATWRCKRKQPISEAIRGMTASVALVPRLTLRPCGGSRFADPPLRSRPPSHRWRGRLLLDQHLVQLAEIAVIDKPADHVHRDLACASPDQAGARTGTQALERSLQTRMKKAVRFDHDHAGSAAVRMAVGQPKEGHRLSVAGETR